MIFAVTMKMMRSTRVTSTSGVTLMPLIKPSSSPPLPPPAISLPFVARIRVVFGFAGARAAHRSGRSGFDRCQVREQDPREGFGVGQDGLRLTHEEVEHRDGRDRDR